MKTVEHVVLEDREVWLKEYPNGERVVMMCSIIGMLSSQIYKSKFYSNLMFLNFKNYPLQIIKEKYAY